MEHRTWLWRKKSSEKTVIATEKLDPSSKGNEEEIQMLLNDKAELENDLKNINEKLSSALSECNAKDDLIKKHMNMAQEAMAGWEKAEAKVVSMKKELDEALQQGVAGKETVSQLDGALKESIQQLRFVREEQEHRIHDAVMKTSNEFEKAQMILEEELADSAERLAKMGVENTNLTKALLVKEKLIEDLNKQKDQAEAVLNALMARVESTDKENASLTYEVRVLEKELEIRNEEREFNRRTADASHKQHLESVKKIAKLESECQRLHLLVRKRLPGPAALAKMRNEVETQGKYSDYMRRRRSNSGSLGLIDDSSVDRSSDVASTKISLLTEQLFAMQEENKVLKEALHKKDNELQFSRAMFTHTASKLSEMESHLDEVTKAQAPLESSSSDLMPQELSGNLMSDIGCDDKVSCAESWASALISELEHFKHGKQRASPSNKISGPLEISLMDDFVEMERLAIVSVDKPARSPRASPNAIVRTLETNLNGYSSGVTGREVIQVSESGSVVSNQETKSEGISEAPDWLQDIIKVVLEHKHVTKRKHAEILEDIRVALAIMNDDQLPEYDGKRESNDLLDAPKTLHVGRYVSLKHIDKPLVMDSPGTMSDVDAMLTDRTKEQFQSDLGKSICKIIDIIEGITLACPNYSTSEASSRKKGNTFQHKNTETPSGYMVRVFQWKVSELNAVLQQFVRACYDLLSSKSDMIIFTLELSSALEWIMNHCFSLQDVSSMRDEIWKYSDWDESRSESEVEVGMIGQSSEADRLHLSCAKLPQLPMAADSNGRPKYSKNATSYSIATEENKMMKDEVADIESVKKELEGRLHSALNKSEFLTNKLQESEKTISSLQNELETMKESKVTIENQIENDNLKKQELETHLTVAKAELNEFHQKFCSLEVELDNKNSCCKGLEAACLDLQLQLESMMKKEIPCPEPHQEEKQFGTDWEITAASEKLAECQETVLNIGKQLKALASSKEAALFDKVIAAPMDTTITSDATTTKTFHAEPKNATMNQRSSLLDQMLDEDNAHTKDNKLTNIRGSEKSSGSALVANGVIEPLEKILVHNGGKRQNDAVAANSLALVPRRKQGGGSVWRKFWRKKKSNSMKLPIPFEP